jgi:hypothetical protein
MTRTAGNVGLLGLFFFASLSLLLPRKNISCPRMVPYGAGNGERWSGQRGRDQAERDLGRRRQRRFLKAVCRSDGLESHGQSALLLPCAGVWRCCGGGAERSSLAPTVSTSHTAVPPCRRPQQSSSLGAIRPSRAPSRQRLVSRQAHSTSSSPPPPRPLATSRVLVASDAKHMPVSHRHGGTARPTAAQPRQRCQLSPSLQCRATMAPPARRRLCRDDWVTDDCNVC